MGKMRCIDKRKREWRRTTIYGKEKIIYGEGSIGRRGNGGIWERGKEGYIDKGMREGKRV